MTLDRVRAICMKLPHATEHIQWNSLVFKICGKIFAIARLEGEGTALSFKCSPEEFSLLTENEGIVQAPYLARGRWASLVEFDILSAAELARRLRDSYDLVVAGLPKKVRAAAGLESGT